MVWFFKKRATQKNTANSPYISGPQAASCAQSASNSQPDESAGYTTQRNNMQISRGPKHVFIENIGPNLALLKRRLPDPNLHFKEFYLGSRSRTKVVLVYLSDLANPGIVSEVQARLADIRAEIIPDASYIERNIQDSTLSPFPQIEKTTRPDVVESALVQGRVGIFTDGSPDVLLAPSTLFDLLDTPDDAYRRWFVASSFFRLARIAMLGIATFLPALFIALTSYLPELIPDRLAFLISAYTESVPLPVYLEAFIMMGIAEAIRMVMLRMPNNMGQTVAMFTGLTLVIAGLYANIISAPVVIIVTLTVLSSMAIPDFDLRSSIRMIQFFSMLMATFLGIFGLVFAFFYITIHLVVLKSFGIPYLAPAAPTEGSGLGHTVLRQDSKAMPGDETYKPVPDTRK